MNDNLFTLFNACNKSDKKLLLDYLVTICDNDTYAKCFFKTLREKLENNDIKTSAKPATLIISCLSFDNAVSVPVCAKKAILNKYAYVGVYVPP